MIYAYAAIATALWRSVIFALGCTGLDSKPVYSCNNLVYCQPTFFIFWSLFGA